MAIKWKHDDSTTMYFCTFTCYNWLPLIDKVNGYDMVYKGWLEPNPGETDSDHCMKDRKRTNTIYFDTLTFASNSK